MANHARYSPSTIDGLMKCLRFRYKETESDAADEGTLLHEAFATGVLDGLTEEQRSAVTAARDYVASIKSADPDGWEEYSEVRVELRDLTYGTADKLLIHSGRKEAHVFDAKFGRISADNAYQIRLYGAAVYEANPSIQKLTTHIVAPRIAHLDVVEYTDVPAMHAFTRKDLEALYARIDNPFLPPTPHEDLCDKCARASECPALHPTVRAVAAGLELPLPSCFGPSALVSAKDRALAQIVANALVNWADQIKGNNTEFVKNGGEIPGFKLVKRGLGMRIAPELNEGAVTVLLDNGLTASDLYGGMTLRLAEITKILSKRRLISEGEAKELLRSWLRDMISEGETVFLQKSKRVSEKT